MLGPNVRRPAWRHVSGSSSFDFGRNAGRCGTIALVPRKYTVQCKFNLRRFGRRRSRVLGQQRIPAFRRRIALAGKPSHRQLRISDRRCVPGLYLHLRNLGRRWTSMRRLRLPRFGSPGVPWSSLGGRFATARVLRRHCCVSLMTFTDSTGDALLTLADKILLSFEVWSYTVSERVSRLCPKIRFSGATAVMRYGLGGRS